jgi:phage tail-like protein
MSTADTAQRLLALLPAIYREDAFLGRYLAAFEQVLRDLEQQIDHIDTLFDPLAVQSSEFLPWLASWMAFTLRADLDEPNQRAFLANVISLYRHRGTKENLQKLLGIFTRGGPEITENTKDGNTDVPHFFHVSIPLSRMEPDELQRQGAIARALIELEKPAHTDYVLEVTFPSMQIGVFSHVGIDTLLGTDTNG